MVDRSILVGPWRRIAPLVILVVALHAALLTVPVRSARPQGGPAAVAPVQIRMLSDGPVAPSSAVALALAPSPAAEPAATQVPPPAVVPPAAPAEPATVGAAAFVPPSSASPPLSPLSFVVPGIDSDADYYPRSMLSRAPAPIDVVVIDYPPVPDDSGHHVSELTLFIDETGRVARVRVDGEALPPTLEAAARAAFVNARFRAGEAAGQAVKSQIRIEVVFDNRPLDRP